MTIFKVKATQWSTHGDHSIVRPLYVSAPGDEHWEASALTNKGWFVQPNGQLSNHRTVIVNPTDWIIEYPEGQVDCISDIVYQIRIKANE